MPPPYAFHLEDLRVFHLVRASCHACEHKAIIPNAMLLQGRPGYTRLMSLKRQLRCQRCGGGARPRLTWNYGPGIEHERGNMAGGLELSAAAAKGGATRVRGQWSGPAAAWFASWRTASVIRRHTASPL